MTRRALIVVAAVIAAIATASAAFAAWTSTGSGAAAASSTTVRPPSAANAASAGASSVKITVTAGPTDATTVAPSGYRVDRLTPVASASTGVCYITTGAIGNCTDSGADLAAHALASSTTYTYAVFGVYAGPNGTVSSPVWTSATSLTGSSVTATTGSAADTTLPTVAANCPTSSTNYPTGNNGGSSWHGTCNDAVTVNASDNVGVASVAIKLQKGTSCWSGTAFTSAACSAAGPTGYPAGYRAATHGAGSVWTLSVPQAALVTAGTGSYTMTAQAQDAAGNASTALSVTFSTSTN